jgi:hypothetical protein
MTPVWAQRQAAILRDCLVSPDVFSPMVDRLGTFVVPYQQALEAKALSLIAAWFLIGETHRGQQVTPALTLPQVRYGLSMLLLEVYCTPGVDSICRQVQRQLTRNESARFYHHRARKCMPRRKLRREIQ